MAHRQRPLQWGRLALHAQVASRGALAPARGVRGDAWATRGRGLTPAERQGDALAERRRGRRARAFFFGGRPTAEVGLTRRRCAHSGLTYRTRHPGSDRFDSRTTNEAFPA